MTTFNVSLPDSMGTFVDQQIAQGGYGTPSEYFQRLVSVEQKRAAQERLEELLMEGIESGPPLEMTAADWEELRSRVWQRHAEGGSK